MRGEILLNVMRQTIKLLALIEATTVTGPAKNLINFCRNARSPEWEAAGLPLIDTSIVTFQRGQNGRTSSLTPGEASQASQSNETDSFVRAARDSGIDVDVLYERFRFDPDVIGQLQQIVQRRAPDVIQTHMIKSHFLVKLSKLGIRYPWVAFHHGYTTTDLKMKFYNQLNRWSLPSATKVVTVCGPFAQHLVKEGVSPQRIFIRHNSITPPVSVQPALKAELREKLAIKQDEAIVLAVGRFSREKGHLDLINAIGILRDQHPGLAHKLVLVGDGPEQSRVKERARQLGSEEDVILAGQVKDVRPYYAGADVLVLPSHSEGSPNVLLEAMAWHLPVVATDVGGVSEVVSDEQSAILVPPHDPQLLATALARMLEDPLLRHRLAEAAAARVTADFSPQSYTRSLIELYSELVQPRIQSGAVARIPA